MKIMHYKQKQNRVWRSYEGGLLLDKWQGNTGNDSDTPEEWVGSTVEARGKNRPSGEGLSVVITLDGETYLRDLIMQNPEKWLGKRIAKQYGDTALLVKLLDSRERLTVQVHPTRGDAKKYFNSNFGKTEGWYILETREVDGEPAYVYLGFKEGITEEIWRKHFYTQDIPAMLDCLHKVYIKPGDCFLIEGGTPHLIGSGCFLLEIQEPTDYTLRVEKVTPQGLKLDEMLLHQGIGFENMLKCFTYKGRNREVMLKKWKLKPLTLVENKDYTHKILIDCDFFSLEEMIINKFATIKQSDDFYMVIVYEGSGYAGEMPVNKADEIFVPQNAKSCCWTTENGLRLLICRPPKN